MTALNCAVLTISDTRTSANDASGDYLSQVISDAGHAVQQRDIVRDNIYAIRACISPWIADAQI
ncbi:MAG: molybdopterin-binding protein, partial [Pseudomonadales bacterium]|nr:molybdopterin-binding protein [Pseudomonadales bacterium]